ncbi:peptidase M10A, Metallopeptidase, catalytic domain protein [Artemisia annua]|uniref:Peptidase M10A, Metallopeptidase, catalytic domain protein n=1 Tax=Artemisia annua TaxID=35608 RepID=A0A2U1MHG6_ARTAN|nr:peptidase M10A, Metallopeptidase, catalytic domain protein [Artemisia annua]
MAFKLSFALSLIFFLAVFLVVPAFSHLPHPHLYNPNGLVNSTYSSPYGFLKDLQGCRKGEEVGGIHNLKLYLSQFGYLNYQTNPNIPDPKKDQFDEELEVALKSYQVFYHLNATGMLDASTLSMMLMPRCGIPDKEGHHHSNGPLHIVSHYSSFRGSPKWPRAKRRLTYGFGPGFNTQTMPPVVRAFSKWTNASGYFSFSRATTYASADLKISFQTRDHGDGTPFTGPGAELGHAFPPTDGRLHFNAEKTWAVGAVPNAFDIESVALHEIGHLLGLNHSSVQNAIMFSGISPGVTKGLNSDDIRGIRALYGS